MDPILSDLKLTATHKWKSDGQPRGQRVYTGTLSVKDKTFPLEVHANDCYGSKHDSGKVWLSVEVGKMKVGLRPGGLETDRCSKCEQQIAPRLFVQTVQAMRKLGEKPVSSWGGGNDGWMLFVMWVATTKEQWKAGRTLRRAPEAILYELTRKAVCPVHGSIICRDTDVLD